MQRMVYVNGHYLTEADAKLSIFDRGLLFADSVYEVTSVLQSKLIASVEHLARLSRSLQALDLSLPVSMAELIDIHRQIVQRNQLTEGILYTQVTRGITPERSFAIPNDLAPSLIVFSQKANLINNPLAARGIKVISVEDIRWQRCDIKTTMLLPASLAKQQALKAGADDAWLVSHGYVNEGSANNAFILNAQGVLITPALSQAILPGITRAAVLALAQEYGLRLEERAFSLTEAYNAAEAFSTGASAFVLPVVSIDGHNIANGKPGEITQRLRQLYLQMALSTAS